MSHYAAFHPGLHCLQKVRVKESSVYNEPVNKMLVHCVNSERSDEPARPRSLGRAFARKMIQYSS